MKVLGNRIMVLKPKAPESVIELTDEAKASMEEEMMKRWSKLEVTHIGDEVTKVKVGDRVYIGAPALKAAEIIQYDEDFYFLVSEQSVYIVYEN